MSSFSKRVEARMRELEMSQTDLARLVDAGQTTVSQWLNDESLPRDWRGVAFALGIPEEEMRILIIEAKREAGKTTRLPKSLQEWQRDPAARHSTVATDPPNATRRAPPAAFTNKRLPVFGQAVGGDDGEFIFNGSVMDYVACPPELENVPDAYGVYIDGESMAPRYFPGELVYVHPYKPAKRGDDVIAQIYTKDVDNGAAPHGYAKKFVGYTPSKLVLEQYNPAKKIEFDRTLVVSVHPIVWARKA